MYTPAVLPTQREHPSFEDITRRAAGHRRWAQAYAWPAFALGFALGTTATAGPEASWTGSIHRVDPEFRRLQARREVLVDELSRLPETPRHQQSGRLGFAIMHFMRPRPEGRIEADIEIDLGGPHHADAVVLVPVDVPQLDFEGPGFGFPLRFRVLVETVGGWQTVFASGDGSFPNPGALPVWIPCALNMSSVRIEVLDSWRQGTAFTAVALGEVMVLQGDRNLTSRLGPEAVRASESFESLRVWSKGNLIDGQSLLGAPVGEERSPTLGYHSAMADRQDETKWVQVDLGESVAIDEVRLIGATGAQFPGRPGFGFPVRFKVELAEQGDFERRQVILDRTADDFENPAANPVVATAEGRRGRFVRVTATKLWERAQNFMFSLGELQVYAGGRNIAEGKPVSALDAYGPTRAWRLEALTDGYSGERRLGEWSGWLRGLSRRREALAELAAVESSIHQRQQRFASVLRGTGAAIVALTIGVIALVYLRLLRARRRELARLRQQVSSDLHDEIGSNLGTIALLAEMARTSPTSPAADLDSIRALANETADAMRDIASLTMRPSRNAHEFVDTLRTVAARILCGHEWHLEASASLQLPSLDVQRHLLLSLKEMLHNVRRHASARTVTVSLQEADGELALTVSDDGVGLPPGVVEGNGLTGLALRARQLKGRFEKQSAPGKGTRVALVIRLSPEGIFRQE